MKKFERITKEELLKEIVEIEEIEYLSSIECNTREDRENVMATVLDALCYLLRMKTQKEAFYMLDCNDYKYTNFIIWIPLEKQSLAETGESITSFGIIKYLRFDDNLIAYFLKIGNEIINKLEALEG